MAKPRRGKPTAAAEPWYRGADIPMREIRRFARRVAERFDPEKIILFGSYAYGTPHADSDVDILVVMPARNQRDQAFKIHWAIRPPFPLDLLVRTPAHLHRGLEEGESFLSEIVRRGKVLYEKDDRRLGAESRSRSRPRSARSPRQDASP